MNGRTFSTSELTVCYGAVANVFPKGENFFPADLEALRELATALQSDLRATHDVPVDIVLHAQADGEPPPARWLTLPGLFAVLRRRRPVFDDAVHARVLASTLARGQRRVEELRALGVAEVLIAQEEAELVRVAAPGWSSSVDLEQLLPDAVATAAVIDLERRSEAERVVHANVTDLVLLAAQCCTVPDAPALEASAWLEELTWSSLVVDEDVDAAPPGTVRVRGAIYPDQCERLEYAAVPEDRRALVGATAVLAIRIPEPED